MLLLDLDGIVCAERCITDFNSVHSRPISPGQLSVLLTSVAEGKGVPPLTLIDESIYAFHYLNPQQIATKKLLNFSVGNGQM